MQCDLSDQYRHDSNWNSCRALPPIAFGVSSSSSSNSCKMTERWCSLVIWCLHEASSLSIDREYEFLHLGQGSTDRRQSSINFMIPFVWLRSQHTSDFAHKSFGIMRSSFRAQPLWVFCLQTMVSDLNSVSRLLNVGISADSSVSRARGRSSSADTARFSDCIVLTRFLKRALSWVKHSMTTPVWRRSSFRPSDWSKYRWSSILIWAMYSTLRISRHSNSGSASFSNQFLWWRGLFCLGYEFGRSISQLTNEIGLRVVLYSCQRFCWQSSLLTQFRLVSGLMTGNSEQHSRIDLVENVGSSTLEITQKSSDFLNSWRSASLGELLPCIVSLEYDM